MTQERSVLISQVVEALRLTASHYGLWLAESVHQVGLETALEAEREAGDRLQGILEHRLCKILKRESKEDLFSDMDEDTLENLVESLHSSWLAADGVWFQAIESRCGMDDAKRANDTCWTRFAPLEAHRIKALLDIGENGGLEALKRALAHRMYAHINTWEIVEETATSFVFRVNKCRVQLARKRKKMDDYPCKSGGKVEYRGFAHEIDPRIVTTCIGCPPHEHPQEWSCARKFLLEEEG
ncbi:MAG: DUF6125 family protein [Desulfoplanes sp.]|nr:DUF6125 family protein [Desulfoplanes sp.]